MRRRTAPHAEQEPDYMEVTDLDAEKAFGTPVRWTTGGDDAGLDPQTIREGVASVLRAREAERLPVRLRQLGRRIVK